jgi:hypothetical protein
MPPATCTVERMASLADCSTWLLYKTIRDGSCPFPFVKVGRRVLFIKARCDEILAISGQRAEAEA